MPSTHFVVRARLDDSPKREAILRSVNLLRALFHVVNIFFTKSLPLSYDILSASFLVLISTPSYAWT